MTIRQIRFHHCLRSFKCQEMVSFIDAIDAKIIWTIVCVPLMEVFQSTGSTVLLIIIGRLTLANKDQNEKVSAL